MKTKRNIFCVIYIFIIVITFSNCVSKPAFSGRNELSLNNTLAIFMVNNENGALFCIPLQYLYDFHIGGFSFSGGKIIIGNYEIPLNRNEIIISVYLNDNSDDIGGAVTGFNLVYLEEKGKTVISKMNEPIKNSENYNHYYIFIEKHLDNRDLTRINREYETGNIQSRFEIWYDILIDNEQQNNSGILDDFEIYKGIAIAPQFYPPNLNFFKAKYY